MYYDLNVPWSPNDALLQRKIAFLAELGYKIIALAHTVHTGNKKGLSSDPITCPIPAELPFTVPPSIRILRRLTLVTVQSSQELRLKEVLANVSGFDFVALRPVTEEGFQHACQLPECDMLSIDMSTWKHKLPFMKTLSVAVKRGLRFEICYGHALHGDERQRRDSIALLASFVRVLNGKGLIISGECRSLLEYRAPADVINLAYVWGLKQEVAVEAISTEARKAVVNASFRKSSYRGIVDVVHGGERPTTGSAGQSDVRRSNGQSTKKRKIVDMSTTKTSSGGAMEEDKILSKRQQKKLRREQAEAKQEDNKWETAGQAIRAGGERPTNDHG